MKQEKKSEWRYIGELVGDITFADGTHRIEPGSVVATAQDLSKHPLFEPVKPGKPNTLQEAGKQ